MRIRQGMCYKKLTHGCEIARIREHAYLGLVAVKLTARGLEQIIQINVQEPHEAIRDGFPNEN